MPPQYHQDQSLFFRKLPLELRLEIYDHILASEPSDGSSCDDGASEESEEAPDGCDCCCRNCCSCNETKTASFELKNWRGSLASEPLHEGRAKNLIPLLQTCHRAYDEVTPVIYSSTTFMFKAAEEFLKFNSQLSPTAQDTIRSVVLLEPFGTQNGQPYVLELDSESSVQENGFQNPSCLDDWKTACRTLASFHSLRGLEIQLNQFECVDDECDRRWWQKRILEPLRTIQVQQKGGLFVLEVFWDDPDDEYDDNGACMEEWEGPWALLVQDVGSWDLEDEA